MNGTIHWIVAVVLETYFPMTFVGRLGGPSCGEICVWRGRGVEGWRCGGVEGWRGGGVEGWRGGGVEGYVSVWRGM